MASHTRADEGLVATSIPEWADKVKRHLEIPDDDPAANEKIFKEFGIHSGKFRSGSKTKEEEYLRLRTIWYTWKSNDQFAKYMRNNPALTEDECGSATPPPYTGYVSTENDELANALYTTISHRWSAYLEDIRSGDMGLFPSLDCGPFQFPRVWQASVTARIQSGYTEQELGEMHKHKVRHSDVFSTVMTASMAELEVSGPSTPKRSAAALPASYGTPSLPTIPPSAGGMQNPATTDETYVNTALLLFLQALVISMDNCDLGKKTAHELVWLGERLPLYLRSQKKTGAKPEKIMESRVDGYLCRPSYEAKDTTRRSPKLNVLPLALLEAKSFTRLSAMTQIRYQESAEIACWVSSLDDGNEEYGLLQPSSSGRYRRLLLSQNRHEIWIIIAEYGRPWKEYIRGHTPAPPTDHSQEARDLAGSPSFVQISDKWCLDDLKCHVTRAKTFIPVEPPVEGSKTRLTVAKQLTYPGPDHFCIMQQWGPFKTKDAGAMDLLLRRLIALHVQLRSTCPESPAPEV